MNILLFDVSNVGKTCTGKVLADRLGLNFIKSGFSMLETNNDIYYVLTESITQEQKQR
jgi:Holliday junction resolvasome RuvABC ATP-dependent DNA helicase subunit